MIRVAQFFNVDHDVAIPNLYVSTDGIDFSPQADWSSSLPNLRDGSIIYHTDGYYYIVFTYSPTNVQIWRSLGPGDSWSLYVSPDFTSFGFANLWAPEFFVDPDDGSVHIIVAGSTTGGLGNFRAYEIHPTTPGDLSAWDAATALVSSPDVGTGGCSPGRQLDNYMVKKSGTYYLFSVDNIWTGGHQSASSITGTFGCRTIIPQFNYGFGSSTIPNEGYCVQLQPDGTTWRLYWDHYSYFANGNIRYLESTDDWATWTPSDAHDAPYVTVDGIVPDVLKQGTVIPIDNQIFGTTKSINSSISFGTTGGRVASANSYFSFNLSYSSRLGLLRLGAARLGFTFPENSSGLVVGVAATSTFAGIAGSAYIVTIITGVAAESTFDGIPCNEFSHDGSVTGVAAESTFDGIVPTLRVDVNITGVITTSTFSGIVPVVTVSVNVVSNIGVSTFSAVGASVGISVSVNGVVAGSTFAGISASLTSSTNIVGAICNAVFAANIPIVGSSNTVIGVIATSVFDGSPSVIRAGSLIISVITNVDLDVIIPILTSNNILNSIIADVEFDANSPEEVASRVSLNLSVGSVVSLNPILTTIPYKG